METLVATALVELLDCLVLWGIAEPLVLLVNLGHVVNQVVLVLLGLMAFPVCAVGLVQVESLVSLGGWESLETGVLQAQLVLLGGMELLVGKVFRETKEPPVILVLWGIRDLKVVLVAMVQWVHRECVEPTAVQELRDLPVRRVFLGRRAHRVLLATQVHKARLVLKVVKVQLVRRALKDPLVLTALLDLMVQLEMLAMLVFLVSVVLVVCGAQPVLPGWKDLLVYLDDRVHLVPVVVPENLERPEPKAPLGLPVNLVPTGRTEVQDLMVFQALRVTLGGWDLRVCLENRETTDPVATLVSQDLKETLVPLVRLVLSGRGERPASRDLVETLVSQGPKVQLVAMVLAVHLDLWVLRALQVLLVHLPSRCL